MHKYYQLFVLLSFITLLGCNDTVNNPLDKPVVEVGDKSLTRKELYDLIPDNIPKDDSTIFAQDYLNRWIRSELMLRKAELNLTPEEKDVTKLLEEYRRSLLVHQYQQKMLLQKFRMQARHTIYRMTSYNRQICHTNFFRASFFY